MDKRWKRVIGAALLVAAFAWISEGNPIVASAATNASAPQRWQLVDNAQRACFSTRVHDAYFGIWIRGTWTRAIDVGASNLPTGATFDTSYAPIPPGSSTGVYSLAYVHVSVSVAPPVGTYAAWLWASVGRTKQQVPVTIDVRARCGSY